VLSLDVPYIKFFAAATRLDQEMLLLVLRGNEKELWLAAQDCSSSLALDDMERHPGPTIAALMKLSFDEEHRHAMCQLGGLHAVAELIQVCESTTTGLYSKCNISDTHSRNTNKMQLVIEFIIPKFIEGSTCFERHIAHHQEL
jgi:hypothetical protein